MVSEVSHFTPKYLNHRHLFNSHIGMSSSILSWQFYSAVYLDENLASWHVLPNKTQKTRSYAQLDIKTATVPISLIFLRLLFFWVNLMEV